jgi:acetylglutamate kinase
MPARNLGKIDGEIQFQNVQKPVASGVTVTDGDFVKLVGGVVTNATIGTGKLFGVVQGGDTVSLDARSYRNTAVGVADGSVQVLVSVASENRYELPVNAALAADAEGSYYNLTGATGAQVVANATKSTTVGQLLCVQRVLDAAGAYTKGVFLVAANAVEADAA